MNGFTDKPVGTQGEDKFKVGQYILGLSEFIIECDTPMTIAIQGDWGSGKTSMMNMIREQLGDKIVTTWFNTWQYSQFNMGDTLAVSFLSRLIADLETEDLQKNAKMKKALWYISKFVKSTGVIMVDTLVGGKAAETVENGMCKAAEKPEIDMPQAINELKEQFQLAVNEKIAKAGKDRLVIFIDDLDRLHPGKAVELLEVLKLFLDCEKCVFVLAIDYEVVSQGVKQKYGELIGEEKGRSFFDKIIQVPFKMPVAQYDVNNYVMTSLASLGIELTEKEMDTYVNLIQNSVSTNPRAMKRLFNAFLLLNKVAGKETVFEPNQRKILFAALCLQLSFEPIYNYIVSNPQECRDGTLFQALTSTESFGEGEDADKLPFALQLHSEEEIIRVVSFMKVFLDVLDQDADHALTEDELSSFTSILNFTTITANTATGAVANNSPENYYRYYNRDIIKRSVETINDLCGANFKVYQTRTNNAPNWKMYYAGGLGRLELVPGSSTNMVGVSFKITTHIQKKESELSIWVFPEGKTDRFLFCEKLREWGKSQSFGFEFLESDCGYWLHDKVIHADAKSEIINYFTDIVPDVVNSINACLKG